MLGEFPSWDGFPGGILLVEGDSVKNYLGLEPGSPSVDSWFLLNPMKPGILGEFPSWDGFPGGILLVEGDSVKNYLGLEPGSPSVDSWFLLNPMKPGML